MKMIKICDYSGESLFSNEEATIFVYWYKQEFRCDSYREAKDRMFIPNVSQNPPEHVLRSVEFWRAMKKTH